MSALDWIQAVGTIATTVGLAVGGAWAYFKLRKRREHATRVVSTLDVKFIGRHGNGWLVMLVLGMVNSGFVRYELKKASFELRCAFEDDDLLDASDEYGGLRLPRLVKEGSWLPGEANLAFLEPNTNGESKHLALVPGKACLLQLSSEAEYSGTERAGTTEKQKDMVVVAAPGDKRIRRLKAQ